MALKFGFVDTLDSSNRTFMELKFVKETAMSLDEAF